MESNNLNYIPNISLLYCQQAVMENADISLACSNLKNPIIKAKALPCSSKVETPHMLKILGNGADGVYVLACEEENCRFNDGSTRAEKRVRYAQQLLIQANLDPKQVGFFRGHNLSADEVVRLLVSYSNSLMSPENSLEGALV